MRKIDMIIIHCSATKAGVDIRVANIARWHREWGYAGIGYHYVIRLDGRVEQGREATHAGAHCRGWNERSIGICYVGGLDGEGHPADSLLSVYHSSAITERQDKSRKSPPGWIGKVLIGIVILAMLFMMIKKAASRK